MVQEAAALALLGFGHAAAVAGAENVVVGAVEEDAEVSASQTDLQGLFLALHGAIRAACGTEW